MSDEFTCPAGDPCTVQANGWTEQYPDRYDNAPVVSSDELTISPGISFNENVWFMASHGGMISKDIPGGTNFVVETLVNTRLEGDPTAVPNDNWNVGGIILRSATEFGNWIVFNIGLQGPYSQLDLPQTLGVEAKSTTEDNSIFNYHAAPPATTGETMTARLRLCKVGSTFRFLYQFIGTGTGWSEIHPLNAPSNPFDTNDLDRPDLSGDLQAGIMTNSMGYGTGGDPFVATFEYIRFGTLVGMGDCSTLVLGESEPPTNAPSPTPTLNPTEVSHLCNEER